MGRRCDLLRRRDDVRGNRNHPAQVCARRGGRRVLLLVPRLRGAGTAVFLSVTTAVTLFSSYGFATIRAQMFTLLFLALMLCFLEIDQRGRRRWILLWLPLYVVWLNVHAGFVVGAGLMALHACEQIVRRRPFAHFFLSARPWRG